MEVNTFLFRRATNLIAFTDDKLLQRSFEYMKFLQTQILQSIAQNTVLMDETAVYLKDHRRTKVQGMLCWRLQMTFYENYCCPGCANKWRDSDTSVNRKGRSSEIEKKYDLCVVYRTKAWVTQCLLKRWIQLLFTSVLDTVVNLLVWDSCWVHIGQTRYQDL